MFFITHDAKTDLPGIIVQPADRVLASSSSKAPPAADSDDDEDQGSEPVKVLEHVSEIKEMTVWGHDQEPAADDAYRKGIEEWLSFADAIHRP